jgi:hypothetical protein
MVSQKIPKAFGKNGNQLMATEVILKIPKDNFGNLHLL